MPPRTLFAKLMTDWWSHPRTVRCSMAARGLYAASLSYSKEKLNDGNFDGLAVTMICHGDRDCNPQHLATELVNIGAWTCPTPPDQWADDRNFDDLKFEITNWAESQETNEQIEKSREADRTRKADSRDTKRLWHMILALGTIDGITNTQRITATQKSRHLRLARELNAAGCTEAAEIERRANNYRRAHPDWTLTAQALVKHWASIEHGPQSQVLGAVQYDEAAAYAAAQKATG